MRTFLIVKSYFNSYSFCLQCYQYIRTGIYARPDASSRFRYIIFQLGHNIQSMWKYNGRSRNYLDKINSFCLIKSRVTLWDCNIYYLLFFHRVNLVCILVIWRGRVFFFRLFIYLFLAVSILEASAKLEKEVGVIQLWTSIL